MKRAWRRDQDLIRDAVAGDRDAFAALFDRHYEFMYRVAYRFAGNRPDAEDIAQETSVKMARHLGRYRFEARFSTWLYRLTMNTAKDWAKKAHRKHEQPWPEGLDLSEPGKNPETHVMTRELLGAVDLLPSVLRQAVFLVFRDGLSHRHAASALGCAESTVSWRIHQARKILVDKTKTTTPEVPRHA